MGEEKPKSTDVLAKERTDLATERTVKAADRTLLAWVRTALSMISFGFTIYKFLQYLQQEGMAPLHRVRGPRNLGMALISLGVISLALACLQYWSSIKRVRGTAKIGPWNLSLWIAGIIALIGILALMDLVFKIGPF